LSDGVDDGIGDEEENGYNNNPVYNLISVDLLDEKFSDLANIKAVCVIPREESIHVQDYQ